VVSLRPVPAFPTPLAPAAVTPDKGPAQPTEQSAKDKDLVARR